MKKNIIFICTVFLFSCTTKIVTIENLNDISIQKRTEFIENNLNNLSGAELGNFIYQLEQNNFNFYLYNSKFQEKLSSSKYAYDMYILVNLLMKFPENKEFIENHLNNTKDFWDYGNWGEKFWQLISEIDFKVFESSYYTVKDGNRNYNTVKYLNEKIEKNELGPNPLLTVNWEIINYEDGNLIKTLDTLNIKQIDYIPKENSIPLFGYRGRDGKLDILTK